MYLPKNQAYYLMNTPSCEAEMLSEAPCSHSLLLASTEFLDSLYLLSLQLIPLFTNLQGKCPIMFCRLHVCKDHFPPVGINATILCNGSVKNKAKHPESSPGVAAFSSYLLLLFSLVKIILQSATISRTCLL